MVKDNKKTSKALHTFGPRFHAPTFTKFSDFFNFWRHFYYAQTKTRFKIKYKLLARRECAPESSCALTFTNKNIKTKIPD